MNKIGKIAVSLFMAVAMFISVDEGVANASLITPDFGTKHKEATVTNSQSKNQTDNGRWKKNSSNSSSASSTKNNDNSDSSAAGLWKNPAGSSYMINVGLNSDITTAAVSMNTQYRLLNNGNNKILGKVNGGIVSNLGVDAKGITLNGKSTGATEIRLTAVNELSDNSCRFNGRDYRGELLVQLEGRTLTVINVVLLDDYLKSVIPSEMQSTWSKAALEAQAVAARTFALYNTNKHKTDGFNLCTATHCQVYEGIKGETPDTTAAVNATWGQAMVYKGMPIYAPFHSSSGGMTENSEDVWGNYLPYLRAVADDDSKSPYHNWKVTMTATEIQKCLASNGYDIGSLKSIEMSPAKISKEGTPGRSASGRVTEMKFNGTAGSAVLSGIDIRQILGLKSTMFGIGVQRSAANNKTTLPNSNEKNTVAPNGSALVLTGASDEKIVIEGHGFGHGLGMAQWGAKAMADSGSTWQQILNYYYTGIEIKKLY